MKRKRKKRGDETEVELQVILDVEEVFKYHLDINIKIIDEVVYEVIDKCDMFYTTSEVNKYASR